VAAAATAAAVAAAAAAQHFLEDMAVSMIALRDLVATQDHNPLACARMIQGVVFFTISYSFEFGLLSRFLTVDVLIVVSVAAAELAGCMELVKPGASRRSFQNRQHAEGERG